MPLFFAIQQLIEGFLWQTLPAVPGEPEAALWTCLLYTSDAADDLLCVDLGGRRIIKKKNSNPITFSL